MNGVSITTASDILGATRAKINGIAISAGGGGPFGGHGTLTTGLALYYSMDDADNSSGNPQDLSGNGNHGTVSGATSGTAALINEGFTFDGVNDYIETGYSLPTTAFSISGWYRRTVDTDSFFGMGCSTEKGTPRKGIAIRQYAGSDDDLYLYVDGTLKITSSTDVLHNTTYHVVVTYDGSGNWELWLNGSSVGTVGSTSLTSHQGTYRIGAYRRDDTVNAWEGWIDEFGIWTKKLSDTEVGDLYNSGSGLAY